MRPWFQFSLSHQTSCKSETCWWWTSMIMVFVQKHVWLILYSWLLNISNILNILSLSSKYTYIQKLGCHGDLTNNQAREATQLLILWAVELTHAMIGTSVNQKLCSVAISFRPPPPLNQQPWFSTAGSADLPPYIQKAKNFADSDDHVDSSECVWLSLWLWHCVKYKRWWSSWWYSWGGAVIVCQEQMLSSGCNADHRPLGTHSPLYFSVFLYFYISVLLQLFWWRFSFLYSLRIDYRLWLHSLREQGLFVFWLPPIDQIHILYSYIYYICSYMYYIAIYTI